MSVTTTCLGVVLAGGASTRMGRDKANLSFAQSDLLTHTKSVLQNAGITHIVVSGNKHQVPDLYPNQGPVSGIISVLAHYRPESLVILPVDMPLLTCDIIKSLIKAGQLSNKASFYHGHPLPLYLPNNAFTDLAINKLKQQMSAGASQEKAGKGPSIRALLNDMPQQELSISDKHALFNANTPEQWRMAQQHFNKRNKHEQSL